MLKIIFKLLFSKINNTKSQFFSLVMICAIGVAMYVGVLDVSKMMQQNAQAYFDKQKASDIEVLTPFLITDQKIDDLIKLDNSINYEKYRILDVKADYDSHEYIAKIQTNLHYNIPYLVKGKQIREDNDCYVDANNDNLLNKKIKINLNGTTKQCLVVGLVDSPQYLSIKYRGYSSISPSKINLIIYSQESYTDDYFKNMPLPSKYNALSISYPNKTSNNTFTNNYQDFVDKKLKIIKKVFNEDYLTSRFDNKSIDAFYIDSERIKEIGAIFPIIFFLVTALVCSSAMTRNIQDDRMLMGTISSMGYSNIISIFVYFLYAFLSTIIGSIMGFFIGFHLIPPTVMKSYSILYSLPNTKVYYDFDISLQALGITLTLIIITTLVISFKETHQKPAQLLRPKTPIQGKKILIEKINFLWKRLKFLSKVNLRNIFRYKKRLLMSILAIMGCSGLLMTGLGILSSVEPIIDKQFSDIYHYQALAYTDSVSKTTINDYIKDVKKLKNLEQVLATYRLNGTININNKANDITIISPESAQQLNKIITFNKSFTDNSVIVTRKIADKLHLKSNDNLRITYQDEDYVIKITGITDNYVGNYLYINHNQFTKSFKINKYNTLYLKLSNTKDKDVLKKLEDYSFIKAIDDDSFLQDIVAKSLASINNLVYIMIAFAGFLVIIVSFSLTSINIIERKRELATLKVLGFNNLEVSNYVLKENLILSILGLSIGLVFGTYLHHYIMSHIEANDIYFIQEQPLINYIIAFVITIIFTLIVNIIMKSQIKKIDMVESLKSIE
ncbi:MAG: ABC transporter permease [Bacilli bacterium]|jgi:putative ABC transport system permease protein|nr:ABC transporter permease [Bacilli bacterium]